MLTIEHKPQKSKREKKKLRIRGNHLKQMAVKQIHMNSYKTVINGWRRPIVVER